MYGRPDLYGSTRQGLSQNRLKQLADGVANELFGSDSIEAIELEVDHDEFGFFSDQDAQMRAFEQLKSLSRQIAKLAGSARRMPGDNDIPTTAIQAWDGITAIIGGDLNRRRLPPRGSGAEYLARWKGMSPDGLLGAIHHYASQMALGARKSDIDKVVESAYPLSWLLYIAHPRDDVWYDQNQDEDEFRPTPSIKAVPLFADRS